MSKESKIKLLIFFFYLVSLFLFELIYIVFNFNKDMQILYEMDAYSPLIIIIPTIMAGIYHFMIVSIIAIICRFIQKINKVYKPLIYSFPLFTFILTIPMFFPVTLIARKFGVFK